MKRIVLLLFSFFIVFSSPVLAISDPREKPNNTFGIGILSPEADLNDAAKLVNTNGDWGWVVIVINKNERDVGRWQPVLNNLNKNHLIPIVRIATSVDSNGFWQKPEENDANDWVDFLTKLYFPTKNRYVQIYNEVNSAKEWGGNADPKEYARELSKTADALHSKSDDFFILESPMDLALKTGNGSQDAGLYYKNMDAAIPGVFLKLDGWASHSYPNPDFAASPLKSGRTGIDGYRWELAQVSGFLKNKKLPVFITETGWKRSIDGMIDDKKISDYYKIAFSSVWNDKDIVAICPFILSYPDNQFYQFSFKKEGAKTDEKYFDYYFTILNLEKIKGQPERTNSYSDVDVTIPDLLISNTSTEAEVKMKNTGNYIWKTNDDLKLETRGENLTIEKATWSEGQVYPGEEAVAVFKVQPRAEGKFPLSIKMFYKDHAIADKSLPVNSVSYFSFLLGTIKKISLGSIFYSSAKLMSL